MALSVATKFATVFLIPAYLSSFILQYIKVKIPWVQIWVTALGCMGLAVLAASQTSGNFQPWYLLLVLPFAALLAENRFFSYVAAIVTVVIAGTYLPFLYLGNWDKPVPSILLTVYVLVSVASVAAGIYYAFAVRKR